MRSIAISVLCFLSCICKGQIPEYYVYLVKGDITVQKANKKVEKIKQKDLIFKEDVLTLPKNSEVTLVNKDASYVVLNAPATIKASELGKKIHESYTGVTKKYLNLVWHELLDPNYDYTKFKQQNLGGVWGGVSRGDNCNNLIFPVNGLKTSMDSIMFKWHKTSTSSDYTLTIFDGMGAEIVKLPVGDTVRWVNLKQVIKTGPGKYYWLIKSSKGDCEDEVPLYFELMSANDEIALVSSLLPQTLGNDLVTNLEKLDKLEKNALILKASEYYQTVIKENPGNLPLLKSYIVFLFKYGFDLEAESAWENLVQAPR